MSAANKNMDQGLVATVQVKKLVFLHLLAMVSLLTGPTPGCKGTVQGWDPVSGGLTASAVTVIAEEHG